MCLKQHLKTKISSARNVNIFWKKTWGAFCARTDENVSACGACQCCSTHALAVWGSHIFRWREGATEESCPWHMHRANGCCYHLFLGLAAQQCVLFCPLGAEGTHWKTDPTSISFEDMDVEQFLGIKEDLAIQPCALLDSHGDLP